MAETSHEIRRELESTRETIGNTIAALERKVNPRHVLDEHPIAAVGLAFGTGVLLGTTGAAGRAAGQIRDGIESGAGKLNDGASDTLDRLLQSVLAAASKAIVSKVNILLEDVVAPASNRTARTSRPARAA